jgi:hypothetical protein
MAEHLEKFATTVQKKVTRATIIQPMQQIDNAVAEYCVSSGYVLIQDPANSKALVTHISNVVLELPTNA